MTAAPTVAVAPQPLLEILGLEAAHEINGTRFSLSLASLSVESGVPIALVGPSGSGKSTLLDALGLVKAPRRVSRFIFYPLPDEPLDVAPLIAGRDDRQLTDLRRDYFGYMPQTGGLLPFLSVAENIRLPARIGGVVDSAYVDAVTQSLELPESIMNRYPRDISIGQRQRVSLARALANRPRLLLADEPTASLDALTARSVGDLLLAISPALGITSIIATHDETLFARDNVRRISVSAQAGKDVGSIDAVVNV
jgi:putative ABC transport system ATP-binding protein